MPTKDRRENVMIERFLSGYENRAWTDAEIRWLDEEMDSAVEAVATRKSDGLTLAIEHTIIEPFVGEKADFAEFAKSPFLHLEQETALILPHNWVQVFIPVGFLRGIKPMQQQALAESLRSWL